MNAHHTHPDDTAEIAAPKLDEVEARHSWEAMKEAFPNYPDESFEDDED